MRPSLERGERAVMRRGNALLALSPLVLLLGLSPWGLLDPDEGRYAEVAREMLARADFLTPHFNGAVFLDKPPLVTWVTAGSLALLGHGEVGARFGQLLFALVTLFATWKIGQDLFERRRARIAVLILASSTLFFMSSHILTLDMGLACCLSVTLLCYLRGYRGGEAARLWYLAMAAAAAAGVLAKGLIGALLPAMTVGVFLYLRGDLRAIRRIPWASCILLFSALAVPWYLAMSIRYPDFPGHFLVREQLTRFATTVHHRAGPWYYYLVMGFLGLLPWSLIVPIQALRRRPALAAAIPAARAILRSEPGAFLVAWVVPAFVFLSVSQSKLPLYILPLFPALALMLAAFLDRDLRDHGVPGRGLLWPSLCALALGAGGVILHGGKEVFRQALDELLRGRLPLLVVALILAVSLMAGFLFARRGGSMANLAVPAGLWSIAILGVMTLFGNTRYFDETRYIAGILREERTASEPVYSYKCSLRGLPFYLEQTVPTVLYEGDALDFAAHQLHDLPASLPPEDFVARIRGRDRVFAVLPQKAIASLQKLAGVPIYVLAQSDRHALVSNDLSARARRDLILALQSAPPDLADHLQKAAALVPEGALVMLEVERDSSTFEISLVLVKDGAKFEVEFPVHRPDQASIEKESPVVAESSGDPHILRMVPSDSWIADLGRLQFAP